MKTTFTPHTTQTGFRMKTALLVIAMAFSQSAFAEGKTQTELDDEFTQAMNARDSGDLEASIQQFQDVLSSDPTLGRVRVELAVSYFRALNFAAAKEQAEKVLNDPNTPPQVKANVQKFLELVERESSPHAFTPYVNLGIGHDTNINVGPSTATINIGGAQLVAGATAQSSNFTSVNVGLAHRYLSNNAVEAFGRSAAFLWNSNASYSRINYLESGNFDLNVMSVSTGPMLAVANRWRAGLDFTFDYIDLGHTKLAEFYGIAPNATFNLTTATDLTVNALFQKREFNDNNVRGRDSDYQMVGGSVVHRLFGGRITLQAGANVFNENVEDRRFGNDGYQVTAGINYKASDVDNLYARHSFRTSKYDAPEILFNERRDENENRSAIGFTHRFTNKYTPNWLMDASITYTENDANLPIFQYYRTQFALNLGKQF